MSEHLTQQFEDLVSSPAHKSVSHWQETASVDCKEPINLGLYCLNHIEINRIAVDWDCRIGFTFDESTSVSNAEKRVKRRLFLIVPTALAHLGGVLSAMWPSLYSDRLYQIAILDRKAC